jgi:predicted Fe-Mo cluster-binding NifX family protein
MTKIAIPLKENLLSELFGECSGYFIYDISNKSVIGKKHKSPPIKSVLGLFEWVTQLGITDLIVHRMDEEFIKYFSQTKINLFIGVPIDCPEKLIEEYLKGELHSDVSKVFQTTAK